jgi:hypothetical protein
MDINEINKRLKQLKEAMGVAKENTTRPQYAEVQPHFEELIKYYEGLANEIAEKNANKGALTINDLNQKYRKKYLYFNGDEDGDEFVYVDKIHMKGDEFVVDGTILRVDVQEYKIEIENIKNYAFHDFLYFDDYYAPFETCEELDKALESNPMDTDLPSHVVSRKYLIECVNCILGSLFAEETGDYTINDMFEHVHVKAEDILER